MKLRLVKTATSNTENFPRSQTKADEEMAYLWDRLNTNSHSDSDGVRQTILARMIYLTFLSLPK